MGRCGWSSRLRGQQTLFSYTSDSQGKNSYSSSRRKEKTNKILQGRWERVRAWFKHAMTGGYKRVQNTKKKRLRMHPRKKNSGGGAQSC